MMYHRPSIEWDHCLGEIVSERLSSCTVTTRKQYCLQAILSTRSCKNVQEYIIFSHKVYLLFESGTDK
jgi:hypothetical protein